MHTVSTQFEYYEDFFFKPTYKIMQGAVNKIFVSLRLFTIYFGLEFFQADFLF